MLHKLMNIFKAGAILLSFSFCASAATTRYAELRATLQPNTTGPNGIFVGTGTIQNFNASTATIATLNVTSATFTRMSISTITANQVTASTCSASLISASSVTAGAASIATATISNLNLNGTVVDNSTGTHNGSNTFNGTVIATASPSTNIFQSASSTFTTLNTTTLKNGGTTTIGNSANGVSILGTNTNDSATAGNYGEYISSLTASGTLAATTTQWGDLVSQLMQPGDYDCSINIVASANGGTITDFEIGLSSTSGNSGTGLVFADNWIDAGNPTASSDYPAAIPRIRVSIANATTYYVKHKYAFSVATPKSQGGLKCRRAR